MAVKLSQSLKQTQNLMMTPQLQQAIKLLTLTHLEMTNVIADEMVENPMLEEIEANDQKLEGQDKDLDYEVESLERQNKEVDVEKLNDKDLMGKDDFDWNNYVESYNNSTSYTQPSSMSTPSTDELPSYENIISKDQSLADHLIWQLQMESLTDGECALAHSIIHNVNDDGYLEIPYEELVANSNIDKEDAVSILHMIQRLDPVGCGSRDLVECLLAQARIAEERSPLLEKIIRHHLDHLKTKDYDKIVSDTGASKDLIKQTAFLLQNFHPKPGRLVAPLETHYVVPDIYVHEVGGEFVVNLNDEGVPRLKVSQLYKSLLRSGKGTQEENETKEYVQDKLRSAMWLIKSIQNRQRTIVKVATAIVKEQQAFFKKGAMFLRPMVLKDIARDIGMHESTVSRVTTNKYMHTPIGLFELKYFFTSGVSSKDGSEGVSSEALKLKIKHLIDNEDPKRPLSDQKILELLERQNVKIARRTVAKYRELLGIMSSSKRKIRD